MALYGDDGLFLPTARVDFAQCSGTYSCSSRVSWGRLSYCVDIRHYAVCNGPPAAVKEEDRPDQPFCKFLTTRNYLICRPPQGAAALDRELLVVARTGDGVSGAIQVFRLHRTHPSSPQASFFISFWSSRSLSFASGKSETV